MPNNYLIPTWPAPSNIRAYSTTRYLNLRSGIVDEQKLTRELNLPHQPSWLKQEHTNIAVHANLTPQPVADAAYTTLPNVICAVLTADCLPILICDQETTVVAAIHAGWRGLANGIIEATLKELNVNNKKLLVWLGPAIGPNCFEVGDDVREVFVTADTQATQGFKVHKDRWLANIYLLATQRLHACNVTKIYGGEYCTFSQPGLFFSYRRDGTQTGRMASLIWIGKNKFY